MSPGLIAIYVILDNIFLFLFVFHRIVILNFTDRTKTLSPDSATITKQSRRLTCYDYLEDAGDLLVAHFVVAPAQQGAVIEVRHRSVVEPRRRDLVCEPVGRNFGQVPGVVERPVEGHYGRIGIDLTAQSHGLLLQRAV
jgi:hypothetical protein